MLSGLWSGWFFELQSQQMCSGITPQAFWGSPTQKHEKAGASPFQIHLCHHKLKNEIRKFSFNADWCHDLSALHNFNDILSNSPDRCRSTYCGCSFGILRAVILSFVFFCLSNNLQAKNEEGSRWPMDLTIHHRSDFPTWQHDHYWYYTVKYSVISLAWISILVPACYAQGWIISPHNIINHIMEPCGVRFLLILAHLHYCYMVPVES